MHKPIALALGTLACLPVFAAESVLTAGRSALLEEIEAVLADNRVNIDELATTDSFALIYGSRTDGGVVTITVKTTSGEETRQIVTVASDTPADEAFDRNLLAALRAVQG